MQASSATSGERRLVMLMQGLAEGMQNLQPWRTALELARHLGAQGWRVLLLSDASVDGLEGEGLEFESVASWGAGSLGMRLAEAQPDALLWAVAPTTIRHAKLLDGLGCPVYPLLFSPAYSWRQLLGVALRCAPHELRSLVLQQCVPALLWRRFLMHPRVEHVHVTSENSLARLLDIGIPRTHASVLRVGLDEDLRALSRAPEAATPERSGVRFLYLGSAKKIRGFHLLLGAMRRLAAKPGIEGIEFRLLTRGAAARFGERVAADLQGTHLPVTVRSGTLERAELLEELRQADVVLLPFLLAPSDVPIAVLEAMALGKPVISTRIDGIPELLEGRGVLLAHRTQAALASAILGLHQSPAQRRELGQAARQYAAQHPTWSESMGSFAARLEQGS